MRRFTPQEAPARPDNEPLSSIELQILELMSQGYTLEAIALKRDRSLHTVKSQVKELYRKLGAVSATHAVGIGFREGWLKVPPEALELVDATMARDRRKAYVRTHLASGLARRAREETGVSVERVSHLCGVPVQSVHYWERTFNIPNTDNALDAYCELLRKMIEAALRPDPLLSLLE